jgi:hypothetical protein
VSLLRFACNCIKGDRVWRVIKQEAVGRVILNKTTTAVTPSGLRPFLDIAAGLFLGDVIVSGGKVDL